MNKFLKIVAILVLLILLRLLIWGVSVSCYILMAACFLPVWEKIVPEESKTIESDLIFLGVVGVFWLAACFFIKPFLEKKLITPLMTRIDRQEENDEENVIISRRS